MEEAEIIQDDAFDRSPDKIDTEETGNEGVDSTHFYHNAVSASIPGPVIVHPDLTSATIGSDHRTRSLRTRVTARKFEL